MRGERDPIITSTSESPALSAGTAREDEAADQIDLGESPRELGPPMRTNLLQLFQTEVERQCRYALLAWVDLQGALPSRPSSRDRVWCSVQSFLVATANVSRLLWPGSPGRGRRPRSDDVAAELRESLQVADESPLKLRTARDHLEHFDQRLEDWARTSRQRNFVDGNIGSTEMLRVQGLRPEDWMRHLDPATMTLIFQDQRYPLPPLAAAVRDLIPRATAAAERTFRSVDTARGTVHFLTSQ